MAVVVSVEAAASVAASVEVVPLATSVVYWVMMKICSRESMSAAVFKMAYLATPVCSKPASTMEPTMSPRGYTVEPEVTTSWLFRIMAAEGR